MSCQSVAQVFRDSNSKWPISHASFVSIEMMENKMSYCDCNFCKEKKKKENKKNPFCLRFTQVPILIL